MPAFGPTDAYKESAGFSREYANWNFQQYKDWLNRMQSSGAISDRLRDQLEQYAQRQIQDGFASPEDIRAIAERIVPGLEDAIQRRQGRLNDLQDLFNARTMPADTMARIEESIQGQAGDITRTGEQQQQEIDDLYSRTQGTNDQASREVVTNIGETAGSLTRGINDTFGGARAASAGSRDRIFDATGRTYDNLGQANRRTTQNLLRSGEGAFDEMRQQRDSGYGSLRGQLGETIGSLTRGSQATTDDIIGRASGVYGGARTDTADTFRNLEGSSVETYDSAIKDAESLRPNSEAQVARVARQFAPAVAASAARLRRRGLDSGDPQFDTVMREVEADRARAMDDSAAASGERAVDRINELRIGRQGAAERLGVGRLDRTTDLSLAEQSAYSQEKNALRDILNNLGLTKYSESRDLGLSEMSAAERQLLNREAMRQGLNLGELERNIGLEENRLRTNIGTETDALGREIDLSIGQNDRNVSVNDRAGRDYREELIRRASTSDRNDINRTSSNLDLADSQYNRTTDWRQRQQQSELLRRAIEGEDFERAAQIASMMNGEEITAMDLRNQAYQQGRDWVIDNYSRQDAGAANLGNIYAREGQREQTAAQTARGFGQDAEAAYNQTRQQEAGKGGWGTRLLLGAAQVGASFIPGVGPAISQGIGMVGNALQGSSAMGGGGGQGAYGSSGAGTQQGGGASNPYNFGWVIPAYQQARQQQTNARIGQAGVNQLSSYGIGNPATPTFTQSAPRIGSIPNNWRMEVDPLPR